jgi:hypothetical protein
MMNQRVAFERDECRCYDRREIFSPHFLEDESCALDEKECCVHKGSEPEQAELFFIEWTDIADQSMDVVIRNIEVHHLRPFGEYFRNIGIHKAQGTQAGESKKNAFHEFEDADRNQRKIAFRGILSVQDHSFVILKKLFSLCYG